MFIQNKYYTWYFNIVNRALQRDVDLSYTELHHIIPKSLGGSNEKSNIVKLSGREHFICHFLLTKFTTGQAYYKMLCACRCMKRSRKYQHRYINSRLYEVVKQKAALLQSKERTGKKLSLEHRAKISKALTGRIRSQETIEKCRLANTGSKRTEEQKLKMSASQKEAAKLKTPEQKAEIAAKAGPKISKSLKGVPKSEEHKKALSQSLIGVTKGIPKSEETKQRMRKPKSEEHKKAISEARIKKYAELRASKHT